jgi:hypothetical protein
VREDVSVECGTHDDQSKRGLVTREAGRSERGQPTLENGEDQVQIYFPFVCLADLTFGEMIDMKRNGSVRGYQPAEASADGGETRGKRAKPVRLNKHRPLEVTSKKPVSRHREIQIDAPRRKKSRDPRFDTMSGRFDDVGFAKSYEFLDGYRQIESAELKVKSRKTKDWKKSAAFKLEAQQLASQTSMRQQKLKVHTPLLPSEYTVHTLHTLHTLHIYMACLTGRGLPVRCPP